MTKLYTVEYTKRYSGGCTRLVENVEAWIEHDSYITFKTSNGKIYYLNINQDGPIIFYEQTTE